MGVDLPIEILVLILIELEKIDLRGSVATFPLVCRKFRDAYTARKPIRFRNTRSASACGKRLRLIHEILRSCARSTEVVDVVLCGDSLLWMEEMRLTRSGPKWMPEYTEVMCITPNSNPPTDRNHALLYKEVKQRFGRRRKSKATPPRPDTFTLCRGMGAKLEFYGVETTLPKPFDLSHVSLYRMYKRLGEETIYLQPNLEQQIIQKEIFWHGQPHDSCQTEDGVMDSMGNFNCLRFSGRGHYMVKLEDSKTYKCRYCKKIVGV